MHSDPHPPHPEPVPDDPATAQIQVGGPRCDLRTAPVIPVHPLRALPPGGSSHVDGERDDSAGGEDQIVWVGFRELLVNAHRYRDLAITLPPAMAGMLRVLYVLVARVTDLDQARTRAEFDTARHAVARAGQLDPDKVDKYLFGSDVDDRWDLFDPVWPWWQDPRLIEQAERKTVNALLATRPGGNTPVWWEHTWTKRAPAVPVAEALQWLLVHHWYGAGSAGGTRAVTYNCQTTKDQYMSAGPLRGTVSFYPLGRTLFETLVAGIPAPTDPVGLDPTPSGDAAPGGRARGGDVAVWERATRPEPTLVPRGTAWPAGHLTGRSRHALLLVPDAAGTAVEGCYLTWAYKPPHPPMEDPYTILDRDSQGGWRPRSADATRALWRDLDALLADQTDHHRPAILTAALALPENWQQHLRVRACGWDQDRKATDRMMFTATTPHLLQWMQESDPDAANGAADLRGAAEEMATQMATVLRRAFRSLATGTPGRAKKKDTDSSGPWGEIAALSYWPNAEILFWQLLQRRQFQDSYWDFLAVAQEAVDIATRPVAHHPPVAREIARAHRSLVGLAARRNPRPRKENGGAH